MTVGTQIDELPRGCSQLAEVAPCPTLLDQHAAASRKPELRQRVAEGGQFHLRLAVVLAVRDQRCHHRHALVPLRSNAERAGRGGACEQTDELPALHHSLGSCDNDLAM
jgi:hypothetical protein